MLYFPNLLASYTVLESYRKDGRVQKADDCLVHTVSLSQTNLEIFSSIATYQASSQSCALPSSSLFLSLAGLYFLVRKQVILASVDGLS